jgi:hypothetical protein
MELLQTLVQMIALCTWTENNVLTSAVPRIRLKMVDKGDGALGAFIKLQ